MFLVTEKIDGLSHITPLWCEKQATTLLNKILNAGGVAEISEVCYE